MYTLISYICLPVNIKEEVLTDWLTHNQHTAMTARDDLKFSVCTISH